VRTIASRTRPPGPKGLPFVGNASQYTRDPFGFMLRCREFGPVAYARLSGRPHFQLNEPADVAHVLITNHRNYSKGAVQARESSLFGNGLLLSEGEFWRGQRRLMQPAFHRRRVDQYARIMTASTERMLAGWRDGAIRDIHHDMMKLTLEIAVEVLFGADVHDRAHRLARAFAVVGEHFQVVYDRIFFVPEWVPIPGNRRYRQALDSLDREVDRIIQDRRAAKAGGDDLLALLLEARDDDGRPMSDRQLRDEVMGLFMAGHETTAHTLGFACHLLGHHPNQEAKLLAELHGCLGGRLPTVDDLPRLHFTEQVTKEALRLYPAVYSMLREARQDDELGGYHVPAGTTVVLPQWVIHRDGRVYQEPEDFAPERWTTEFERRLPRCAYFPFGAGPRVCIGSSFALMELRLILPTILARWHLEPASAEPLELMASITTRPRRGIAMVVHQR
jgi:cytochrome P450